MAMVRESQCAGRLRWNLEPRCFLVATSQQLYEAVASTSTSQVRKRGPARKSLAPSRSVRPLWGRGLRLLGPPPPRAPCKHNTRLGVQRKSPSLRGVGAVSGGVWTPGEQRGTSGPPDGHWAHAAGPGQLPIRALPGRPSRLLLGPTGLASNMHPYCHNHPLSCHRHRHHHRQTGAAVLGEQAVTPGAPLKALHVEPVRQADGCPSHVAGAVTEAQRGRWLS